MRAVEPAVERERSAAEQTGHDVDRLGQAREALARARHLHADRVVLGLVPTRAETDVEPTTADAVERRERLGEHRRRPQRFAHHERAEADVDDARASAPSVTSGS